MGSGSVQPWREWAAEWLDGFDTIVDSPRQHWFRREKGFTNSDDKWKKSAILLYLDEDHLCQNPRAQKKSSQRCHRDDPFAGLEGWRS